MTIDINNHLIGWILIAIPALVVGIIAIYKIPAICKFLKEFWELYISYLLLASLAFGLCLVFNAPSEYYYIISGATLAVSFFTAWMIVS